MQEPNVYRAHNWWAKTSLLCLDSTTKDPDSTSEPTYGCSTKSTTSREAEETTIELKKLSMTLPNKTKTRRNWLVDGGKNSSLTQLNLVALQPQTHFGVEKTITSICTLALHTKKKKQKKKHGMTPVGIGARVIIFELHPREQGPSPPTRSSKGCEEKEKVKQNQKKTWSASAAPRRWQPGEPKRLNYNRRAPKSISAPLSRLKLLPHSNTAAIRSAICQAQKIGKKNIHKRSRELPVWGGPLLQQPRRRAVPDTRMMRSVRG